MKKTILTILVFMLSSEAYAFEQVLIRHDDYVIDGANLNELKQSIREKGFKSSGGLSYAAKTYYDIKWQPVFDESEKWCQLKALYTAVEIEYSLPVLSAYNILSKDEKDTWRKYYKSLKEHEEGHGMLGIDAAKAFKWQAMNLFGKETCAELKDEIESLAQSTFEQYHNKNLAYDMHTKHGHEQGAVLVANILQ